MTVPPSRAGAVIVVVDQDSEDVWLFLRATLDFGEQESGLEAAIYNPGPIALIPAL
jgi:hypothetical protein